MRKEIYLTIFFAFILLFLNPSIAYGVSDPRLRPNNKVGVGLLSPESEIEESAQMINNNGDWGWVVIIIKKSERNVDRWQKVFNLLNKNHLIPIVRLATDFDSKGYWQRPADEDAKSWADFLSKLYWPTKNRYVQVYNEVNHAQEWGNKVDPSDYAKELYKTIAALREKSDDFFVLNSPMDLASPDSATSMEAGRFMDLMASAKDNIFSEIDGWASHSYPNPNFSSSPSSDGKTSINGFSWELAKIGNFTTKDLPVFITETGWKRSDSSSGLSEDTIAQYYKIAFDSVWNSKKIAAVTPFIYDYPDAMFNTFSFKVSNKVLGKTFYNYYYSIKDLIKEKGQPERKDALAEFSPEVPDTLTKNFNEKVTFKIKNTGNYIWDTQNGFRVEATGNNLSVLPIAWESKEVFPGQEAVGELTLKATETGNLNLSLKVIDDNNILGEKDFNIKSESMFSRILEIFKIKL